MIPAESVPAGVVERQHAGDAHGVLQRDSQRGTQSAEPGGIVQITRFHGWIAVDDRLTVFRHPAREALAHGDFQGREEAEVLAIDVGRYEAISLAHIDDNRIVRNQAAQAAVEDREGLMQVERVSQVLRQLIEHLEFLAGRRDGREELGLGYVGALRLLEPGCGGLAAGAWLPGMSTTLGWIAGWADRAGASFSQVL